MQAVWYEQGGPAGEVMQYGNMDTPEPGAGEVRVRMAWSAVNPYDIKKRVDGRETNTHGRIVPHADGSGEIDRVGEGVSAQRIGEQVWLFGAQVGQAAGTCAQYCVLPAWKAVALTNRITLKQGACLGIPAVTAVTALNAAGSLKGKHVLVAGGAGRVGAYAVQFARLSGALVTATASAKDCALVEQLGAKRCFDYADPELSTQLQDDTGKKGYDLIVEPRFGSNIALNARVLSPSGVIAGYGFDDNRSPVLPAMQLVMRNAVCRFVGIFGLGRQEQETVLQQVNGFSASEGVQHRVGMEVALTDAASAHAQMETGRVSGAALISI
jgi:NADPH:quinone reductase